MKRLYTLDVCAHRYTVWIADPSEVTGMDDDDEGYCRSETCEIFINKKLHVSRVNEVLLHELTHAIFDAAGIGYLLNLYLPGQKEAQGTMEELTVRAITPALITVLRQIPKVLK